MPFGPGKYDAECTEIRERLKAEGVVLLVFGGNPGFSAQLPFHLLGRIPSMLRSMADQIEASEGPFIVF
jgi:hypothetical protein